MLSIRDYNKLAETNRAYMNLQNKSIRDKQRNNKMEAN